MKCKWIIRNNNDDIWVATQCLFGFNHLSSRPKYLKQIISIYNNKNVQYAERQ